MLWPYITAVGDAVIALAACVPSMGWVCVCVYEKGGKPAWAGGKYDIFWLVTVPGNGVDIKSRAKISAYVAGVLCECDMCE